MPKMKTKSGAKKRFKITGSGKVKRSHAFHGHKLDKKSQARKKRLVKSAIVEGKEASNIKKMLGKG